MVCCSWFYGIRSTPPGAELSPVPLNYHVAGSSSARAVTKTPQLQLRSGDFVLQLSAPVVQRPRCRSLKILI